MSADTTLQLTYFMIGFAYPFLADRLTRQVGDIYFIILICLCKPDQLFYIYSLCLLKIFYPCVKHYFL